MKGKVLFTVLAIFTGLATPLSGKEPQRSDAVEVARIRRHLAGAKQLLVQRDVSALTPAQRRARWTQIQRLDFYTRNGKFPHNHGIPGRRAPYFVDRHGTMCAMAYLINATGRHDLVALVAQSANNATVTELTQSPVLGPALGAWLRQNGLTVEEAQRIQPAYDYAVFDPGDISTSYAAASVGLGALNLVSIGINGGTSGSLPRWVPFTGIITGVAGTLLGASRLGDGEPVETLGLVNTMVGGASIIAGIWGLARTPSGKPVAARASGINLAVLPRPGLLATGTMPLVALRAEF